MALEKKTSLPIILTMVILVFALIYALFIRPNYHLVNGGKIYLEAVYLGKIDATKETKIVTMGDGIYIATREGLTKFNQNHKSIWNKSFHLNELLFLEEDPYLAVVDVTDKEAYIFNENGSIATIKTDFSIVSGSLNKAGFLTLTLEDKDKHFIDLYDSNGNLVVQRRTIFKEDGYPIDVVMSDDATKMMTSHLDVSQHTVESVITFLDFSSAGEDYTDKVVGHERLKGTMASELHFFEKDYGVIVGDDMISFYYMEKLPELIKSIPIDTEILDLTYTDEDLIINFGDALVPEGDEMSHKVIAFNNKGDIELEIPYEEEVSNLSSQQDLLFVIQASHVTKYKGTTKIWETDLNKDVRQVYELNNNHYLIEYDYDYEILKVKDI